MELYFIRYVIHEPCRMDKSDYNICNITESERYVIVLHLHIIGSVGSLISL